MTPASTSHTQTSIDPPAPTDNPKSKRPVGTRNPKSPLAPPELVNPQPGDSVPIGNACPVCGTLRDSWVYHPFLKVSQKNHGWVIHRSLLCACPESDPYAHPAFETRSVAPTLDQDWLDDEFRQRLVRAQTFLTFRVDLQAHMKTPLHWVEAFSHRFPSGTAGRGVFLAGPPCTGKGHLLAALTNAARAQGHPAVCLSMSALLEHLMPLRSGDDQDLQQHARRRRALRAVPVLAVKAMFSGPSLPSELRELDLLLEYREAHARTTHFAAPFPACQLAKRVAGDPAQLAALAHRLARLTDTPITLPANTYPFTPEMHRALAARPGSRDGVANDGRICRADGE